jgi:hypothetical protein
MTDQLKHKAYHSWAAIDIAKDYNVVMVELTDGKTRCFRMANSGKDHDRLIEVIRELPQPCHIGFEATGNYHRPLAYRLLTEGFDVSLISSLASARYREAIFNSWDKRCLSTKLSAFLNGYRHFFWQPHMLARRVQPDLFDVLPVARLP